MKVDFEFGKRTTGRQKKALPAPVPLLTMLPALPKEPMNPIARAFRETFLRGLEQWTLDLRAEGSNLRYVIAGCRNEWNASADLGLPWKK